MPFVNANIYTSLMIAYKIWNSSWSVFHTHPVITMQFSVPPGKSVVFSYVFLSHDRFSQPLWFISQIIRDGKCIFQNNLHKKQSTMCYLQKPVPCSKILSSSLRSEYLSVNMSVQSEWQVLVSLCMTQDSQTAESCCQYNSELWMDVLV